MGLRGILFWPVYRLADWVDDNPVSAAGAVVALAALAVLAVSIEFGSGGGTPLDTATTELFLEAALERPAYPVVTLVGIVVALFYDG